MPSLLRLQTWEAAGAHLTYQTKVMGTRKTRRLLVASHEVNKLAVWRAVCIKLRDLKLTVIAVVRHNFATLLSYCQLAFESRIMLISKDFLSSSTRGCLLCRRSIYDAIAVREKG
jgi:phosphoribosyl-dephospho-CoA transferase